MASAMSLEVQVKLNDLMSGGIKKIEAEINHLHHAFERVGRTFETLSQKMGGLGIAASFGAGEAIKKYAEFDDTLNRIGIQASKSGAQLKSFKTEATSMLQSLAKEVDVPAQELLGSLSRLSANGIPLDEATTMLKAEAVAARAMYSDIEDITNMSTLFRFNFDFKPEEMEKQFAIINEIAKHGEFKANDIAHVGQTPFAYAAAAGTKDVAIVTSMLEVARRNTATAGEAATNLSDLFSNFRTKHFKDRMAKYMHVDVDAVQTDALFKNQDPNLSLLQLMKNKAFDQKDVQKTLNDHEAQIKARAKKEGTSEENLRKILTEDTTKVLANSKIGQVLINQQGFQAAMAIFKNWSVLMQDIKLGHNAKPEDLLKDAHSANDTTANHLKMTGDNFEQALTRAGQALSPFVDLIKGASDIFNKSLKAMDKIPGLVDHIFQDLTVIGGAIGIFAAKNYLGIGGNSSSTIKAAGEVVENAVKTPTGSAPSVVGGGNLLWPLLMMEGIRQVGTTATYFANDVMQRNDQAREALQSNSMLGAMGGDYSFAAGIIDAKPLPKLPPLPSARRQNNTLDTFGFGEYADPQNNSALSRAPAPPPPPQKVDVGGQITIKVDGPGTISGVSSTNPNVPITTDRGTTALRP